MTIRDDGGATADCAKLILGFAHFVDQRRYTDLVALFAADGVFARPGFMAEGHDAIMAYMAARPDGTATRHVCATPFFEEVGDDSAAAVTYVTMFHGPTTDDGAPVAIVGAAGVVEFHDIFTRTAVGWRIAHHESRVVMIRAQ